MRRLPQNAEEAALVLQKVVRGRAARDEQEEVRRNHWLQHHYDRGEWDDALMLAVSPEERAVVIAGRDEAASLTIQKTVRARAARELVEEERAEGEREDERTVWRLSSDAHSTALPDRVDAPWSGDLRIADLRPAELPRREGSSTARSLACGLFAPPPSSPRS